MFHLPFLGGRGGLARFQHKRCRYCEEVTLSLVGGKPTKAQLLDKKLCSVEEDIYIYIFHTILGLKKIVRNV